MIEYRRVRKIRLLRSSENQSEGGRERERKRRKSTVKRETVELVNIDVYRFLFPLRFVNSRVLAKFLFVPTVWSKIELFAIRCRACRHRQRRKRGLEVGVRGSRPGWKRRNGRGRNKRTVHFPLFRCGTGLLPRSSPGVRLAAWPLQELLNPRHFTGGSARSWSCFLPFARFSSTYSPYRIITSPQYLGINFPDARKTSRRFRDPLPFRPPKHKSPFDS